MKDLNLKLLDNYQLYQLIQNKSLDEDVLTELKQELKSRRLNKEEEKRIENKYNLSFSENILFKPRKNWNPIFTAFDLNYHFKYLAQLKILGKKNKVKEYMTKLYIGLILYFFVSLILVFTFLNK